MGSKNSKSPDGILIELDKPYYFPGELIFGKIYLNLFQNHYSSGINLTIQGEEFVSYSEMKIKKGNNQHNSNNNHNNKNTSSNNQKYVKKREGKTIIYRCSELIIPFHDSIIQAGQYIFPFSFILPSHLPGSFEYYDNDNFAYIKYIIQASSESFKSHQTLKNDFLLILRQSPLYFHYPTRLSNTQNLSTWCFFNKGSSTLNISYEKNYYCPEEKVNVICELDNTRCKLKATSIKLSLIQTIILKNKQDKNRNKILSRVVNESRYDGQYNSGQENTRTLELILNDDFNPTNRYIEKCDHHHLFKEKNLISKLQASVKSNKIECKYHFKISVEFDSCLCCSKKPNIEIPIIMYIPDLRHNLQLYQPNNWNPQLMPLCEINLPNELEIMNVQNQNLPMMTNQTQPTNFQIGGMGVMTQTNTMNIENN